eukprot:6209372-Pleurochrysis_carterae.AAC.3
MPAPLSADSAPSCPSVCMPTYIPAVSPELIATVKAGADPCARARACQFMYAAVHPRAIRFARLTLRVTTLHARSAPREPAPAAARARAEPWRRPFWREAGRRERSAARRTRRAAPSIPAISTDATCARRRRRPE